jgi:hypothetical protein
MPPPREGTLLEIEQLLFVCFSCADVLKSLSTRNRFRPSYSMIFHLRCSVTCSSIFSPASPSRRFKVNREQ